MKRNLIYYWVKKGDSDGERILDMPKKDLQKALMECIDFIDNLGEKIHKVSNEANNFNACRGFSMRSMERKT